MEYEIVEMPEKLLAGITKRIADQSPPMSLWGEYYSNALPKIEGAIGTKAYGLYYDFSDGCKAMVACEVTNKQSRTNDIDQYTIPAGKYAKFHLCGEVHHIVPLFWKEINDIELDRSYICDFEIFPSSETEDVDIEI